MRSRGPFLDPDRILKFENHDQAYYLWRDRCLSERILLHIDAHHDMYGTWPGENLSITIANFILPALQENVVREVVWAVPDETWMGRIGRNDICRAIKNLRRNGIADSKVHERGTSISTTALGKPLTICSIEHLPAFDEPVLLDVDVDYLVIPNIGYRGAKIYSRLPWLWPRELVFCLAEKQVRTDLVTIAYSVEGGYTPLQWKYLGDELAVRLQQGMEDSQILRGMDAMRLAACAAQRGDFSAAAKGYLGAKTLMPQSAAPDFHLAHLYAAIGLPETGRVHYREAMTLDDSYRTPYSSTGLAYYTDGRWRASRAAHERTLLLDEDDPYAHLGLGLLSLRARSWRQAQGHFCRTLQFDESNIDALRGIGASLVRQGDSMGAIQAYERSLKYALLGHRSLLEGMISSDSRADPADSGHWQTHIDIAKLYAQTGDRRTALAGYRMGIAAGTDGVGIRLRLAHLLFCRGDKLRGMVELGCALGRVPFAIHRLHRKFVYRLRRLFADRPWLHRLRLKPREETSVWN
jgi:tetratricopeptide (TPR) repeat protein